MDEQKKEITEEELKSIIAETIKANDTATPVLEGLKKEVEELKTKRVLSAEERAEKSLVFVKECVKAAQGFAVDQKTITTSDTSFGYSVPTELANAVHEKRDKIAKIRPNAFVFSMAGKFDLPTEGTGVTAYWVTTEADTDLTESNPTVSKTSLDDWYLAARVRVPYKLLDTSGVNVENYISSLAGRALASYEETAFVSGTGSSQPTGIRSATITSIDQAGADLAYDDLVNLYYTLPEQYRVNASWLTSSAGMKCIRRIKDSNGVPIFNPEQNTVFGRPVLECTDIPSNLGTSGDETEIYFGDLKEYWIKDGQEMKGEARAVPGRLQFDFFLYEAVDGVLVNTDAFCKLQMVD